MDSTDKVINNILCYVLELLNSGSKPLSVQAMIDGFKQVDLLIEASSFSSLSEQEIRETCESFSFCLVACNSPESAADMHIMNSRLVSDVCEEYTMLRQIIEDIAKHIMSKSNISTFRLFFGAALSIFDAYTDIYMIISFYETGDMGFYYASIMMMVANAFMNLLVSYLQNRRKGLQAILKEAFC